MTDIVCDVATAAKADNPVAAPPASKSKTVLRVKPKHPPTAEMVCTAIDDLQERNGSSLQAIKKYTAANYKIDVERMAPFFRRYIKSAVASGTLIQIKGQGASGSFKLASASGKPKAAPKKAASKSSPSKAKSTIKKFVKRSTKAQAPAGRGRPKGSTKQKVAIKGKATKVSPSPKKVPAIKKKGAVAKKTVIAPKKTPKPKTSVKKSKSPMKPVKTVAMKKAKSQKLMNSKKK